MQNASPSASSLKLASSLSYIKPPSLPIATHQFNANNCLPYKSKLLVCPVGCNVPDTRAAQDKIYEWEYRPNKGRQ